MVKSLAGRIVFITGDIMGKDTIAFLHRTSAPYITKPFDGEQIKKDIGHIMTGELAKAIGSWLDLSQAKTRERFLTYC